MKKISSYLIALALTAFTFASCEDVPAPFGQPINPVEEIAVDPEGSGTQADPYNVAAIIAFTSGLDADTPSKEVYFKGFISQIKDVDTSGSYGNATYYITDDKDGKGSQFYIYRGYGLGGQKFNEPNATIIKVGDEVLLKSKVTNYKGTTPETVQNECIIVELNGKKADGSGGGGDDKPTPTPTPTGDNLLVNGDFETWSQDTYPDNWKTETTACNATLSKSTDAHTGSASVKLTANSSNKRLGYKEITLKAGTYVTLFYAKGTGDKNASVATGYASIDEANKLTYNYKLGSDNKTEYTEANTSSWVEISNTFTLTADTKVSIIVMNKGGGGDLLVDDFSLKTSDGGIVDGGGGGTDPQPSINKGTAEAPLTVAQAIALIDSQDGTISDAYVKGIISQIDKYDSNYKSITYWISDDGNTTTQLQVYSGKGLNGADFTAKDNLTLGKKVVIKGSLKKYNSTYEFDKTSSILSIE